MEDLVEKALLRVLEEFKINNPNIAFNIPRLGLYIILEDLFNESFDKGKNDGYTLGYKEGYDDGYNYQPTEVENGWE